MADCPRCVIAAQEIERLEKIIDFLYEALGPANDDILAMAEEAADSGD